MLTPEGFPLIDGQAVASERFFVAYDQDRHSHWFCYRIVHTVLQLPEHLWGNMYGIAPNGTSEGAKIARVPAIGYEDGDPCYWYTKEVETQAAHQQYDYRMGDKPILYPAHHDTVHIALPFQTWAARVPLAESARLRELVREGRIPRMNHGDKWPEI